ncbi:alpha/beta hydrolase [Shewanella cyperi]|uniref:Alpha/beta hydrolase n=1 Tax=Shewanella cyperi TaxID=2814292 RepID=A0A975AJU1_9GAMM|nr:alpha/beta hydrolase [Shewanella cyperi]QSX28667.1 alpha/beta hydrolase [Shewanella cyperi]
MRNLLNIVKYTLITLSCIYSIESTALPVNGLDLQVVVSGHGDTVMLFESGFGQGPEVWDKLVAQLPDNVMAVRYARAGIARSGERPQLSGLKEHLLDLTALAQRYGQGKRLILVGHSYGGLLVSEYARLHHANLGGLLLIDPAVMQQRVWFKAVDADAVAKEDAMLDQMLPPRLQAQLQQLNSELDQAGQQVTPLPSDLNTVLLTSTRVESEPLAFVETAEGKVQWLRLHQALFADVRNGSHLRLDKLGHNMMQEDAPLVLDALKTLL